jgi:hypothetical protein
MKKIILLLLVLAYYTGYSQGIPGNFIVVKPQEGDDWNYLQTAINSCISKGIKDIFFSKGTYEISKPLLVENDGKFFSLNLIGEDAAQFNLETSEARIVCTFSEGFAIGYQMARSSLIKGLVIYGVGRGKDERFNVYSGISIDPYNRKKNGTSGSSGITISNCRIRNFTAGISISQNGVTLNAENIHMEDCSIDGVKVAYATCQRQSKANTVKNLICWENVETVFDGVSYGQGLGVIPYIDGANIAGSVKQIFNFGPQVFATSAQKIFAETIERIGVITDGGAGVIIRDSHFDFDWYKFPDYHFKGNRVTFENCSMRYYDEKNDKRIVIDGIENMFMNGYTDRPFLMKEVSKEEDGRTNYYFNYRCVPASKMKVVAHKDISTYYWLDQQFVDVKTKTITVTDRPINGKVGDYIDTGHPFYPIARIVGIEGNVIKIDNILTGFKSMKLHIGIKRCKIGIKNPRH